MALTLDRAFTTVQGPRTPTAGEGVPRVTLLRVDDLDTVLVRLTGSDHPGITAGLLGVLAEGSAEVLDMEQIVVRARLTLDVLVRVPAMSTVLKDVLFYGWEQGLTVDFEVVSDEPTPLADSRHTVTVIAARLTAEALAGVTRAIAGGGANIERIVRLARYPVMAYQFEISGGGHAQLQEALAKVATTQVVDVSLQEQRLERRAMRLVVLDVDSTLVQGEVIDELAVKAGHGEQVAEITRRAMEGELSFEQALRSRVELLTGLDQDALDEVAREIRLTPGARTFIRTLRRLGYKTAIVSGGFTYFTDTLKAELGLDHAFANELEIVNGVVTGQLVGDIVDRSAKAALLRKVAETEHVPLEQTVAIGDGANDIDMLATAGLGIAFNARAAAQEAADTAVSVPFLDAILFLLGVSRDEVERADRRGT